MRIAIYISDLTPENRQLMPWRMVLEVGKAACRAGHPTRVLSGRRCPRNIGWTYSGCPAEEIAKPYSTGAMDHLQRIIRREELDALFWPVAWCSARRQVQLLRRTPIPIVWYIPGACYFPRQAARAVADLGVRSALPFVLQSVYPKRRLLASIRTGATGLMITASEFTRSAARAAGWPAEDVFAIPPGKSVDGMPTNADQTPVFHDIRGRLGGRPFYLFLGPPTGIRGIRQLLRAFDLLARQRPEVCLVCLFRSDPGSDIAGIRRQVESGRNAERIISVWESVGRADLNACLDACYAVVLPFLLVPSEIPLAVIEAAGHHKPVITTGPGGTADFVREFGLAVPSGHSRALAHAMFRLLDDKPLYAGKCQAAQQVYAGHPTWEEVTQLWLTAADKAIRRQQQGNTKQAS